MCLCACVVWGVLCGGVVWGYVLCGVLCVCACVLCGGVGVLCVCACVLCGCVGCSVGCGGCFTPYLHCTGHTHVGTGQIRSGSYGPLPASEVLLGELEMFRG